MFFIFNISFSILSAITLSRFANASSKIKMFLFFNKALAIAILHFSPPEIFLPSSSSIKSHPLSSINFFNPVILIMSLIFSSVISVSYSVILFFTVSLNKNISCLTIANKLLILKSLILLISIPSISIRPLLWYNSCVNNLQSVVFPEPDLPIITYFLFFKKVHDIFSKTFFLSS